MKEPEFCYACEQKGKSGRNNDYACANKKCALYLCKCESYSKEQITIIKFIKKNGWEFVEDSGEYLSFGKGNNIGIDIGLEDIVLIGESGDFASHQLNENALFWLIGRLFWNHSIAIDFKR